jgi:SAM-dependent methyltransferase
MRLQSDFAHYLDYLPYRQEGLAAWEDFRTAPIAPSHLRDRKMNIGGLSDGVEDILSNPNLVWPISWPYGFEDFRPCDYSRDEPINTGVQYKYSQSLIESDVVQIVPGLVRVPIKRHFIMPKDKLALALHMSEYCTNSGVQVLELFSTYDSILPSGTELGATVGVGWYDEEMRCNAALDDFIEQDITVDPYLPLASNYFDIVVVPAMFQLLQRPKEMFEEINRVLKPGGTVFIGVKLAFWSFLNQKQGRYYVETNYLEDVIACGSFMHYAGGFTKPEAFDLTLPEFSVAGKLKDIFFPRPRLDFYAVVQARKRKNSPHGKVTYDKEAEPGTESGLRYKPKLVTNPATKELRPGPFY